MSWSMLLGRVVLPAVGLLLAAVLAWQTVRTNTSAQAPVTSRRTAETADDRIIAEGRVVAYPGAEVIVGTEVLGTIIQMHVGEKSVVRKGDLLAELRSDDVQASLQEARSRLVEAEADVIYYEQEGLHPDRQLPIPTTKGLMGAGYRRDVSAARARRDSARAAVIRLEAEASKYRILAPIDGVVIARRADPGETVAAATPLLTIADLSRLRVEAEIDEFDIPRLVPGTRVTITAEGYGAQHWEGEVEEIADIVIGRQTRPEDPSRPTDTRILPIKVKLSEPTPLKLGQRVDVQVFVPGQDR